MKALLAFCLVVAAVAARANAQTQTVRAFTILGATYEGEIKDGKANRKGKMVYPHGSTYEGEFRDNLRHGRGESH